MRAYLAQTHELNPGLDLGGGRRLGVPPLPPLDPKRWDIKALAKPGASPHICILTIAIANDHIHGMGHMALMWTAIGELQRLYAEVHGYSLFTLKRPILGTRHPIWEKLPASQALLDSEALACDYVMWWDGDAIPMNFSRSVEDIVGQAPNADMIISGDTIVINSAQVIWRRSGFVQKLWQDTWDIGEVKGGLYENGAIAAILGGCTPQSAEDPLQCFKRVDCVEDPECTLQILTADTAGFGHRIPAELRERLFWVPHRTMNSYWAAYRDGDFLVHCVTGGQKKGRGGGKRAQESCIQENLGRSVALHCAD